MAVIISIKYTYIDDIQDMLNVMIKVNGWMTCDELFSMMMTLMMMMMTMRADDAIWMRRR